MYYLNFVVNAAKYLVIVPRYREVFIESPHR